MIAGPAGFVVDIVAGGLVETAVDKLWSRIETFKNS